MDWSIDGIVAANINAMKGHINGHQDIPVDIRTAIKSMIDASAISGAVKVTATGRAGDASHPAFLQVTVEAFNLVS